ncbi:MAG TPA: protein phosphatase 2C domain-containing protein [Ktedonobacteraceae bacterium]|nr:protein phosphatase 2C domain-containing protein [Ktedonobacteraceae bacterium]
MRDAYISHKWTRLVLCVALGMTCVLLWWLSGGFPPWAWRFLAQVMPRLPELWQQRGLAILLPFAGLLLQSIALLIAWGGLIIMAIRIASHWLQERRELQHFDQDVQGARELTNTMQHVILNAAKNPPVASGILRCAQNDMACAPRNRQLQDSQQLQDSRQLQDSPPHIITDPDPTMIHLPSLVPDSALISNELVEQVTMPLTHVRASPAPAGAAPIHNVAYQTSSQLVVATGLDTGIKRKGKPNEDNLLAFEHIRTLKTGTVPIGFFAVADGMGGHENGQAASRLATRVLRETVLPALQAAPEDENFPELLIEGIHRANLALYQQNRRQQSDMGTTVTAAMIIGDTAYIANVGDSRTYLYRCEQGLTQITRDHSTVARLVEAGAITRDEVYTHPMRNVIYRSLGGKVTETVDTFTVQLQSGDILVLCSDGLWEMVHDPDIETIIRACYPYPSQISAMLVQAALNRGGKDNISLVVVYINASCAAPGKAAPDSTASIFKRPCILRTNCGEL